VKPVSFSRRVVNLKESGTLKILDKVKELQAKGVNIIQLDVGEPDFKTPENIINAAIRAMNEGFTHYTPTAGIPELREAVSAKLREDNRLDWIKKENVILTPGSKQALFYAIMALVGEGDEVIIPTPAWPSYMEMVTIAEGSTRLVPSKEKFRLDINGINEAVGGKTKAIMINSPSNPTGYVASKEELRAVAEIAEDHGICVVSDEIYEKLIYEGEHISLGTFPGMDELSIIVNGFSKAYAMTGWRLGYAAASRPILSAMNKLQQHSASSPASFVQKAGLEALRPETPIKPMVDEFRRRRAFICGALKEMGGFSLDTPAGAFYIFADISATGMKAEVLCNSLLEGGVSTTPGGSFGGFDSHVRISYANSMDNLQQAVARIGRVLRSLKVI
jgi:aspartate aminotransferase